VSAPLASQQVRAPEGNNDQRATGNAQQQQNCFQHDRITPAGPEACAGGQTMSSADAGTKPFSSAAESILNQKPNELPATAYSFAPLSGTDHEPDYLAAAAEQEAGNDRGFDSNVCLIRRGDLCSSRAQCLPRPRVRAVQRARTAFTGHPALRPSEIETQGVDRS
jgi:hypothetical protein